MLKPRGLQPNATRNSWTARTTLGREHRRPPTEERPGPHRPQSPPPAAAGKAAAAVSGRETRTPEISTSGFAAQERRGQRSCTRCAVYQVYDSFKVCVPISSQKNWAQVQNRHANTHKTRIKCWVPPHQFSHVDVPLRSASKARSPNANA